MRLKKEDLEQKLNALIGKGLLKELKARGSDNPTPCFLGEFSEIDRSGSQVPIIKFDIYSGRKNLGKISAQYYSDPDLVFSDLRYDGIVPGYNNVDGRKTGRITLITSYDGTNYVRGDGHRRLKFTTNEIR